MYVVCVARQHLKQQESRTQISLITGRRERERRNSDESNKQTKTLKKLQKRNNRIKWKK